MSDEADYMQKLALALGWSSWELGLDDEPKKSTKKQGRKTTKRETITRK